MIEPDAPRQPRHSRDDVALAALGILDELGLPDLTMRRLAQQLSVQPSALYWHFPNKQSLLAEVADRIVAGVRAQELGHWQAVIATLTTDLRNSLLAYRDGAEVVSSSFALGLGAKRPVDELTTALIAGGFSPEIAQRAATALMHFVLGHVLHEQQRLQYGSAGVDIARPAGDGSHEFRFGVELLTAGLGALEPATSGAIGGVRSER